MIIPRSFADLFSFKQTMLKYLNRLYQDLYTGFMMLRVAFNYSRGRWFYFRDSPDWLVLRMADMPDAEASQAVKEMILEARREKSLRKL